eukprot:gb/GEZJ01003357.1/.p1 GENE.gb/GEZJ01003357.1/~~gb/GEZJ01003357.1/.p1  ORF type:complete len:358 (+),score=43.14 gb/GEZJ01003357.1/:387-1460(+)
MPEMHAPESILLPDANQVCRRTDDHVLSMCQRNMCASMERKLIRLPAIPNSLVLSFIAFIVLSSLSSLAACDQINIVVFICVWKRPLLTHFVLRHFKTLGQSLQKHRIHLELFITGSVDLETRAIAEKYNAGYSVFPNSPLGAKHDSGLQSLRDFYVNKSKNNAERLPDAVTIFGSDDVVNQQFFVVVRDLLQGTPGVHVVGLQDLYFQDLKTGRLVYTRGYKSFNVPISGTLGCGRVYSWAILEDLDWHLWDTDRERGLDQSAVRNVMTRLPLIGEISVAVIGAETGIVAVDIKSDGYVTGTNIWKFEEVTRAVGKNGRLHDFEDKNVAILNEAFGDEFVLSLDELRFQMEQSIAI